MLFNSIEFIFFFPIVTIGFFWLPNQWRWLWLLCASCGFYMAAIPAYIAVLGFTITLDYWLGRMIGKASQPQLKKFLIVFSFASNIGVLAIFKYYNFFNESAASISQLFNWNYSVPVWTLPLPIGLSFHTFQSLSYTMEVYLGKQKAEQHFGIFALYVMFYPQLVAGPIERPQNLLHQFHENKSYDYERITSGLRRIAWGLFKKVVVADQLSFLVYPVYTHPLSYNSFCHVLATAAFAYQIYCDFSGYSDIAVGSARVMGFHLMENFDRPYAARSVDEFWKRWHISLSSWFRDYVYIPLGGNRVSKWHQSSNLLIVFMLSGLWHGAKWNFVIWGAIHGTWIVGSYLSKTTRAKFIRLVQLDRFPILLAILQIGIVWLLVGFAWIFFRANTLSDAFGILNTLYLSVTGNAPEGVSTVSQWFATIGISRQAPAVLGIFLIEAIGYAQVKFAVSRRFKSLPTSLRWSAYISFLLFILAGGSFGESQFIYFQF